MVTSTSTPGSMLIDVICFTTSDGLCKSMSLLWIFISKRSQVLVPLREREKNSVMNDGLQKNGVSGNKELFVVTARKKKKLNTFTTR